MYKALRLAVLGKHTHIIKLLLDSGADVNYGNGLGSVLQQAFTQRCGEMVKLFIKFGANVNDQDYNGYTPIMWALKNYALREPIRIRWQTFCIVKVLLEAGAYPNIPNVCGVTAFVFASHYSLSDVVQLLINNGAKPWCRVASAICSVAASET